MSDRGEEKKSTDVKIDIPTKESKDATTAAIGAVAAAAATGPCERQKEQDRKLVVIKTFVRQFTRATTKETLIAWSLNYVGMMFGLIVINTINFFTPSDVLSRLKYYAIFLSICLMINFSFIVMFVQGFRCTSCYSRRRGWRGCCRWRRANGVKMSSRHQQLHHSKGVDRCDCSQGKDNKLKDSAHPHPPTDKDGHSKSSVKGEYLVKIKV